MRNLAAILIAVTLPFASPAFAQDGRLSARDTLKKIDAGNAESLVYSVQLNSLADGFGWANGQLQASGQPQLFCQPENLATTADQVASILRDYLKQNATMGDYPVGAVLLNALRFTFPCATGK